MTGIFSLYGLFGVCKKVFTKNNIINISSYGSVAQLDRATAS